MTHVDFQCCPLLDFWRTKVWISGTVGAFDSGKSKLAGYVSSFALELGGMPLEVEVIQKTSIVAKITRQFQSNGILLG